MTDRVIEDIRNGFLTAEELTPVLLRESYRNDIYTNGPQALERGRKILDSADDLDQYLHSYGKMGNEQWGKMLHISMNDDDTTIIDYACGQGLSFLNLVCSWTHDNSQDKTWQDYLKSIVLIEPSIVALNRAEAIARLKFPEVPIRTINKKLEALDADDLTFEANPVMIHIFSQILDIPFADNFDIINFFETVTSTVGTHYIHVISHQITNYDTNILKLYKHIVSEYISLNNNESNFVFSPKPDIEESPKIRRRVTASLLNTFNTQHNDKKYISMFACIKVKERKIVYLG